MTMSQPLAEVKSNVKSMVDFSARMGYGGGMARITMGTVYTKLRTTYSGAPTATGTFVLIRIGGFPNGLMAFYDATNGHIYPAETVLRAEI